MDNCCHILFCTVVLLYAGRLRSESDTPGPTVSTPVASDSGRDSTGVSGRSTTVPAGKSTAKPQGQPPAHCQDTLMTLGIVTPPKFNYTVVAWSLTLDQQKTSDLQNFSVYHVPKQHKDSIDHYYEVIDKSSRQLNITGLYPGTNYTVYVVANFPDHCLRSHNLTITSKGYGGDARPCNCEPLNSVDPQCHYVTGNCHCKHRAKGKDCSVCIDAYYFDAKQGCIKCNCVHPRATGSCKRGSSGLLCDCQAHYEGSQCDKCVKGYYMTSSGCAACHCHGNGNMSLPVTCDVAGKCLSCVRNTTGDHCEKCKEGYIGDPLYKRNCTLLADVHPDFSNHERYLIIVIVVCLMVAVAVIVVGVILLKRRFSNFRYKPFNFWTVQLKDDHETVNFQDQMEEDTPVVGPGKSERELQPINA